MFSEEIYVATQTGADSEFLGCQTGFRDGSIIPGAGFGLIVGRVDRVVDSFRAKRHNSESTNFLSCHLRPGKLLRPVPQLSVICEVL
jgi:hypothetical protein